MRRATTHVATARIALKPETLRRLKNLMSKGVTYDEFINELLDLRQNHILVPRSLEGIDKIKSILKTEDDEVAIRFLINLSLAFLDSEVGLTHAKTIKTALEKTLESKSSA